jgi:peptidylprolyl isomerase
MNVEKGNSIKVHYVGTLEDGTEFDNSYKRGEPIEFVVGSGNIIKGFDEGVVGMSVGEKKMVSVPPSEGYGEYNDNARDYVGRDRFPSDFAFSVGAQVMSQTPNGDPLIATILEVNDDNVLLDFNHPMAGKNLNFELELVELS